MCVTISSGSCEKSGHGTWRLLAGNIALLGGAYETIKDAENICTASKWYRAINEACTAGEVAAAPAQPGHIGQHMVPAWLAEMLAT